LQYYFIRKLSNSNIISVTILKLKNGDMKMLKVDVGKKAPDFCLPNQDGEEICLKDFNDQWVVLYFYPKDGTKGCTLEAIDFTSQLPEFNKLGTAVLGLSPDSPKSHQKFIDKNELKVQLLSDEEHKVLEDYGVWQEKQMYGKKYFGVVRSTVIINPRGIISAVWEKVRVKDHVKNVKEKLIELQKDA
jgi:peroxiredoxin Q/BCP